MPITPLAIHAYTLVSALGLGTAATLRALIDGHSGLRPNDFGPAAGIDTFIGRIDGVEAQPLPEEFAPWECRNHRLAELTLAQDGFYAAVTAARDRFGPDRVALLVGTSTSGMLSGELAYRARYGTGQLPAEFSYPHSQELAALSQYLQLRLGLAGPAWTVSTACSSSAKVFADAHRLISAGVCDAAVVGGVDSLCLTTLYGFSSLELVSRRPCRPWDIGRDGISIGEAAGFALLTRYEGGSGLALLGYGESSDAYHMSTPHPEGIGARLAMEQALAQAAVGPEAVDYINLHGTATRANDRSEDRAVTTLFGSGVAASSTKGWTGHTLGAAGITEAVVSWLCIEHDLMPGSLNTEQLDPELHCHLLLENERRPVARVLSNSFGFGGSNCALLFGRPEWD